MTGHDHESGCGSPVEELPELALGALTGRERARVLFHVESCPHCAADLESLSRTADWLALAAPDLQPPMGFESRVFDRMGIGDRPATARSRAWWHARWVRASAAAAVVVLAALGTSLALTSSSPSHVPERTTSAALVEHGAVVGQVTVDGPARSLSMTLADSAVHGPVHCVVVTGDGAVHQVGTFVARAGYGAWIVPLHVDPSQVRRAEVTSSSGGVVASASLG